MSVRELRKSQCWIIEVSYTVLHMHTYIHKHIKYVRSYAYKRNEHSMDTHQLVAPAAPQPCCHYPPALLSTVTYTAELVTSTTTKTLLLYYVYDTTLLHYFNR